MRRLVALCALFVPAVFWLPAAATGPSSEVGVIQNFGSNLKSDCPVPEGIAADPLGNVYVNSAARAPSANICVLNSSGQLFDEIQIAHSDEAAVAALTGATFVPGQGLYVLDFADHSLNPAARHGRLLRVDPRSHTVTTVAAGFSFPNGIAADHLGNVFVSDSSLSVIFRVAPDGTVAAWASGQLFEDHANDLAFDPSAHALYMTSSGDSRVLRVPVNADGSAGAVEVFADGHDIDAAQHVTGSLAHPDGIAVDKPGRVYVAAGREVQVLAPNGKLVARYAGIGGAVLDEPSALVFRGRNLYLTNSSEVDGSNAKVSRLLVLPSTEAWNPALEFRILADRANPSPDLSGRPDLWRYLFSDAPLHDPGHYHLLPNYSDIGNRQQWDSGDSHGSTNPPTPEVGMELGQRDMILHPFVGQFAVIGWTSPIDGPVVVTGSVGLPPRLSVWYRNPVVS
jgi:sugar lactone lactonase YvrE